MNANEIKNAILDKVESDNSKVVEAIANLRNSIENEFVRSVCWTIVNGAKRFGTSRVSEKQAAVIAKEVASLTDEFLRNNFSDEQLAVFGIVFTPAPTEPEAEEVKAEEKTEEVKELTPVEIEAKEAGMTYEQYVASTPERWNKEMAAHYVPLTEQELKLWSVEVRRRDSNGYNHISRNFFANQQEVKEWVASKTLEKDDITIRHEDESWWGVRQKRNMERRTFTDGSLRSFMWMYRQSNVIRKGA